MLPCCYEVAKRQDWKHAFDCFVLPREGLGVFSWVRSEDRSWIALVVMVLKQLSNREASVVSRRMMCVAEAAEGVC